MKVLLSIKPKFVEKILNGTKKYEYRKKIFKKSPIVSVLIYSSSPEKRVVGEFIIEEIIEADLESLWEKTKNFSGINIEVFNEYFQNKDFGYAIKIKDVIKYKTPLSLEKDLNISTPPQSFMYLK